MAPRFLLGKEVLLISAAFSLIGSRTRARPDMAPQTSGFDQTLAFFRKGYDFIGNRCRDLGTDGFRPG
jgi:hypothetical protein